MKFAHPASGCRLRVGVALDARTVPAWVAKVIHDLRAADFAELALVLLCNDRGTKPSRRRFGAKRRAGLLFSLYERLDYWQFKTNPDSLAPVTLDIDEWKVPIAATEYGSGVDTNNNGVEGFRGLQDGDLDVLLYFGSRPPAGPVLKWARYGVWVFQHGRDGEPWSSAPMFQEIYEANPVTESLLKILAEKPEGEKVLCRSIAATNVDSLYRTRNGAYWRTAEFAVRRLRELHGQGWDYVQSLVSLDADVRAMAVSPRRLGNFAMARFMGRQLFKLLRRQGRKLLFKEARPWVLAIQKRHAADANDAMSNGLRLMLPPADRFYGDPFLFKKDGRTYLLFEEYPYPTAKGVISYVEIDENGRWNQPQLALERPYHLSYPFVFESDGEIYLIPETSANRTIELYRALDFPRRWALDRTLMTGVRAVDATVVQHHGKFWLFTCLGVGGASNAVELHLFHADALEGPWHPHRMNPVVSDVRHARPAGRLVHAGGELYRPAQDCSVRYGFAINFRRIKQLSEADYLEVPAGRLDPDWLPGNLATHTIDCNEDFIVLDARLHVREPRWRFREQSSSNRFADSVRAAESRASRIVMPWQGENWLGDCPRKAAHLDREPARIA